MPLLSDVTIKMNNYQLATSYTGSGKKGLMGKILQQRYEPIVIKKMFLSLYVLMYMYIYIQSITFNLSFDTLFMG